jgi:hypothetical protein
MYSMHVMGYKAVSDVFETHYINYEAVSDVLDASCTIKDMKLSVRNL